MSWRKNIGTSLKEIRFIFCQESAGSTGVRYSPKIIRNFVLQNYSRVKEENPRFPFIVRECQGAEPLLIARYSSLP